MIAVMGASGNVGGKVADLLLQEKHDVRVFGRSAERLKRFGGQGAEVVAGDALNADDLQTLFQDADSAQVLLPDNVTDPRYVSNRSQMSRAIAQALRDQGVGHVVFLSSLGADRDRGVGQVVGLHELEELLFGLEDANVLSLRAARHLLRRDFTGHTVRTILGPEDRSMADATRALGAALGIPDLPYVEFPPEGVKAALQGMGMSEEFASLLVESQIAINDGRITSGERTTENTTPT